MGCVGKLRTSFCREFALSSGGVWASRDDVGNEKAGTGDQILPFGSVVDSYSVSQPAEIGCRLAQLRSCEAIQRRYLVEGLESRRPPHTHVKSTRAKAEKKSTLHRLESAC
jgi:hypothetical protein